MRILAPLFAILGFVSPCAAEFPVPKASTQVVIVTAPSWETSTGRLQRWERSGGNAAWKKTGAEVEVVIGRNGMGWGLGLHRMPAGTEDPRKKEGDGKAPAGMFELTGAFGFSAAAVGRMPWRTITRTAEAIDDPSSRYYNRIVDRQLIERPDWRSSEKMARIPTYAFGLVVAHNPKNVPGAGSCIFIHLQEPNRAGTSGCTALRESDLRDLLRWLDPARGPVLIQLPVEVARREAEEFAGN